MKTVSAWEKTREKRARVLRAPRSRFSVGGAGNLIPLYFIGVRFGGAEGESVCFWGAETR